MSRRGKKYNSARQKVDTNKAYDFSEALKLALDMSYAKFDESVDVAVRLGVDPRHADQMVRGSVVLPNGTGKEVKWKLKRLERILSAMMNSSKRSKVGGSVLTRLFPLQT
jgi:hypothetical protein